MGKINALNRAFEKAFVHTATEKTLMDLLTCIGEELECDRISIFEMNVDNTCDNTLEWCRHGAIREQELLQNIPIEKFDSWRERLLADEVLKISDLDTIRETDPDVYELFHLQHVTSVIVSKLAFHGKGLGFFVIENPDEETLDDVGDILPGMRYIISSLVYSDHLVRQLEQISYTDKLTGAGNRRSLQEKLEKLDPHKNLSLIYCETIGWNVEDSRPEHLKEEQMLIRTSQVLCDIYGDDFVFRIGGKEFLVVISGEGADFLRHSLIMLENMLSEHDLLAAIGSLYRESYEKNPDALIRQVRLLAYNEKKALLEEHINHLEIQHKMELNTDELADIHLVRGDEFFRKADHFLSEFFDQPILTAVIDVNYFKLYNDIFGRKAGNLLLENIASSLESEADRLGGIIGYLGGDNFCMILPAPSTEAETLKPFIEEMFRNIKYPDGFTPAIGIYISADRQEAVISMYDRALTPLQEIKGSYMENYRFYDAEHFQKQKEKKLLLMDIQKGLPRGEFIFYLQPQVHEGTGKIVGAEALIRWKKDGQIIPPNVFIPILEKTGYIFSVDCYIWEEVVKWIRSLLDRRITPVSCSVNVSRVDFYFTDIADYFIRLTDKYDIPPQLLGIEITESAFTDNTDSILQSVHKLHQAGFRVLMDDFGSGSSSLSMLHTMHLDVLKTDVRFMSRKTADTRAVSIVESVISMAHMIGMLVVTEGVETEEQRDNLIALGDNYAQGFFFYKPMPVEDFENLLKQPNKLGQPFKPSQEDLSSRLKIKNMIREGMVSDTLLDNIIGPAAVYKEKNGVFTLEQINEPCSALTGIRISDPYHRDHFLEQFQTRNDTDIVSVIHGLDSHPFEGSGGVVDFKRMDGTTIVIDVRTFLLYSGDDYKMYLSTMQKHAEA